MVKNKLNNNLTNTYPLQGIQKGTEIFVLSDQRDKTQLLLQKLQRQKQIDNEKRFVHSKFHKHTHTHTHNFQPNRVTRIRDSPNSGRNIDG